MHNSKQSTISSILKRRLIPLAIIIIIIMSFVLILPFQPNGLQDYALRKLNDYQYTVVIDVPVLVPRGDLFAIQTDNCGSSNTAIGAFSRTLTLTNELNWQLSETLSLAIARDLAIGVTNSLQDNIQSEIEDAVVQELAEANEFVVGTEQTITAEREIITPPDSRAIFYLQWEEIQHVGTVTIYNDSSSLIGEDAFYIVRDLRLSQAGVEIIPCNTFSIQAATPSANVTVTPVPVFSMPPTRFVEAVKPDLLSPGFGEYQNPITFVWQGLSDTSYKVVLIHNDKGFRHESEWLQNFTWSFSVPAEESGNWSWYITSQSGETSNISQFIFQPLPNSLPMTPTIIASNLIYGDLKVEYPIVMNLESSDIVQAAINMPENITSLASLPMGEFNIFPQGPDILSGDSPYETSILVSSMMRMEMTSLSFEVADLFPANQQMNFGTTNNRTIWTWTIKAPRAQGRHVAAIRAFLGESTIPIWTGSLMINVVPIEPAASTPTLAITPTVTPTFTPTPPASTRVIAQLIDNASSVIAAVLVFVGGLVTAYVAYKVGINNESNTIPPKRKNV